MFVGSSFVWFAIIGLTAIKFDTSLHGPQRMNPGELSDSINEISFKSI